jgi:hypothetical protein
MLIYGKKYLLGVDCKAHFDFETRQISCFFQQNTYYKMV